MVEFIWDQSGINYTFKSPAGPVGRHLHKIGRRIVAAAKVQVGKDTNQLAASIHYNVFMSRGVATLEVLASAPHAYEHHEGTRPHLITPNTMKVLKYRNGGTVAFAKAVMHPGTRPNRFLSDNLRYVRT